MTRVTNSMAAGQPYTGGPAFTRMDYLAAGRQAASTANEKSTQQNEPYAKTAFFNPKTKPWIDPGDLSRRTWALSHDWFKGREPGTQMGEWAAYWIAYQMWRIGLLPGNNGSYYQDVPIKKKVYDPATSSYKTVNVITRNVVGYLPGTKRPDEAVLYTAHWDHEGMDPDLPGSDKIYNGAVDNALGVSSLLEVAEAARNMQRSERSLVFIAFTGEEKGFLGSEFYASNPIWAANKTVAAINQDMSVPSAPTQNLIVVGNGSTELENYLAAALKSQGRGITADPYREEKFFERSDHYVLAQRGIPVLMPLGGSKAAIDAYLGKHYHEVSDHWDKNWNLFGTAQNLTALLQTGWMLANSQRWPNWKSDNDYGKKFRPIRDWSMATKGIA